MKRLVLIFSSAVACLALSAPVAAQDQDSSDQETAESPQAVVSEPEEITDRNHPDYVRCRSEPIIGSLARRRRVCMTNAEWAEAAQAGNDGTRRIINSTQPGFMMTPE